VALYVSDSLLQTIRTTVLVIWMPELMLMKDHAGSFIRIFRTVNEPEVAGIPALYRHILSISSYDIEILSIYFIKALQIKHRQPPY